MATCFIPGESLLSVCAGCLLRIMAIRVHGLVKDTGNSDRRDSALKGWSTERWALPNPQGQGTARVACRPALETMGQGGSEEGSV